jgi:hypothetical protein
MSQSGHHLYTFENRRYCNLNSEELEKHFCYWAENCLEALVLAMERVQDFHLQK